MIVKCWSEHRDQRCDIRSVYNQLSESSIQEVPEGERGNQHIYQIATRVEEAVPFPAVQRGESISNVVENPLPPLPHRQNTTGERQSIFVEGNSDVCPNFSHAHCRNAFPILVETGLSGAPSDSFTQPKPRSKFPKREGSGGSQTSLPSSTPRPTPKTRFTFPGTGLDPQEPEKLDQRQIRRRKSAFWGSRRVRTVFNVLRMIFRMKGFSKAQGSPMG